MEHAHIDGPERRTHTVELRVDPAAYGKKTPTIRGYAAKFNILSEPMPIIKDGKKIGTFREKLLPGCFAAALPVSDVKALINHDPNMVMGRNKSGTLRMVEDETGLAFENDPPDTTFSRDIQESMGRGDVDQCSFGFTVPEGGDSYAKDPDVAGGWIRSIRSISSLFDVSIVTYPAYTDTSCAVRSIISQITETEEAEQRNAAIAKEEERARQADVMRRQLELAERGLSYGVISAPEARVNMGYSGYNKVGVCTMCSQQDCQCADCANSSWCNMHTSEDGGCCTKCLEPGCLCLQCPNTDKCTAKQMWSM